MITPAQPDRLVKAYQNNGGVVTDAARKANLHPETAPHPLLVARSPTFAERLRPVGQRAPRGRLHHGASTPPRRRAGRPSAPQAPGSPLNGLDRLRPTLAAERAPPSAWRFALEHSGSGARPPAVPPGLRPGRLGCALHFNRITDQIYWLSDLLSRIQKN